MPYKFRRSGLGELPEQGPFGIDVPDFVKIGDYIVKQLESRYLNIGQTRTSELPGENFYQFKCRKIRQTGVLFQGHFSVTPVLFFTYIVPPGQNVLINTVISGLTRSMNRDLICEFIASVNGFPQPEYGITPSGAISIEQDYNLLLKPLDKYEVAFHLTATGYTFPGDAAFFQVRGWEFQATDATS